MRCWVMSDKMPTRVFMMEEGLSQVRVFWDNDELGIAAYETCVAWCQQEDIRTSADLRGRVVPPGEYEVL
jgi:hypothetical protein